MSRGWVSDRGDQVGEIEPRVTRQSASESTSGRHPHDYQRAEKWRPWRIHLLGQEQAGSQRQEIRRRRGDR